MGLRMVGKTTGLPFREAVLGSPSSKIWFCLQDLDEYWKLDPITPFDWDSWV